MNCNHTYCVLDVVRALDEVRTLYRARALDPDNLDFGRVRPRAIGLNGFLVVVLDNIYATSRIHNFDYTLTFDCALDLDRCFTPNNLSALRSLCCILIYLGMLVRDKHSNSKRAWFKRLWPKPTQTDFDHDIELELRRNAALRLYAFFFLIDERRKGNLPAWEGIRIVREKDSV